MLYQRFKQTTYERITEGVSQSLLMVIEMKAQRVLNIYKEILFLKAEMVDINEENSVPFSQDRFLSNTENKANFINFISRHLIKSGYSTINFPGDAHRTIVKTALDMANTGRGHVTIVADDTDITVMLVHHWQSNMSDVYFFQERWNKTWSIKDASSKSENIKQHLLFVHAWSGCDTVSSVFGKGKTKLAENITDEKWR